MGASLADLFSAIEQVESGGRADAVGDGGASIGPYQIQKPYWVDAGIAGSYKQVKNPRYARKTMLCYWQRYCEDALLNGDFETLARVHNGGPRGHLKESTKLYWKRVRRELRKARTRRALRLAKPITVLLIILTAAGCGYSLRAIHEPSLLEAIEVSRQDILDARDEMSKRYSRLYQQLEQLAEDDVDRAALEHEIDQFRKAVLHLERPVKMLDEIQDNLGITMEPSGNLEKLGAGLAGAAAGLAVGAAL